MPDPLVRLDSALDALTGAFAAGGPTTVTGCGRCFTDEELAALGGPPELVPDGLLASAAAKSFDHWGDFPGLYRRLTPRILRALVRNELHVDSELIASRLLQAAWTDWPAPERDAVDALWRAWWRATLHRYPGPTAVTEVLAVVTVATGALMPWLDEWTATRTHEAAAHLSDLIDDVLLDHRISGLRLGFYGEYAATDELLRWLLSLEPGRCGTGRMAEVVRVEAHR